MHSIAKLAFEINEKSSSINLSRKVETNFMNTILLQTRLSSSEMDKLSKEFPHYNFLNFSESSYKNLTKDQWAQIEIILGNRLTSEEFLLAHQLRWIHSPTPYLNRLCLEEIEQKGNIIITTTKEEDIFQIGEFVIGGILAFAKNLFHWKEADHFPNVIWDSKWRDTMWSLKNRLFLQIGLGLIGTELTRRARQFDMKVFGVQKDRSFHPHCHRTFSIEEMDSLIDEADIISLALPRGKEYENWLQFDRLKHMKEDSILSIVGSHKIVNEDALDEIAKSGKLRGILLDAFYQTPIHPQSKLWKIPNMLITPEVSSRPKSNKKIAFRIFRFNLRQYLHGNFQDMQNLIE